MPSERGLCDLARDFGGLGEGAAAGGATIAQLDRNADARDLLEHGARDGEQLVAQLIRRYLRCRQGQLGKRGDLQRR